MPIRANHLDQSQLETTLEVFPKAVSKQAFQRLNKPTEQRGKIKRPRETFFSSSPAKKNYINKLKFASAVKPSSLHPLDPLHRLSIFALLSLHQARLTSATWKLHGMAFFLLKKGQAGQLPWSTTTQYANPVEVSKNNSRQAA